MGHSHSNHQRGWRAKVPPGPHLASDGPSLTLCTTLPWQSGQPEGCPLESHRWDILKIIVRTGAGEAQATQGWLSLQHWRDTWCISHLRPWWKLKKTTSCPLFPPHLCLPNRAICWIHPVYASVVTEEAGAGWEMDQGLSWACGLWLAGRKEMIKKQWRELF